MSYQRPEHAVVPPARPTSTVTDNLQLAGVTTGVPTLTAQSAIDIASPESRESALLTLLAQLKSRGYRFVTPTPVTHARITARPSHHTGSNLRDVLGWSLPFTQEALDAEIVTTLRAADALVTTNDGRLRSRYRVSSLGDDLFLHSAFPTDDADAVFFGPDSYRFADFIGVELERCPRRTGGRLVDVGTGTGAGAITAAHIRPELQITMTDINARALWLARINARAAGVEAEYALGSCLDPVDGTADVVIANPPYIVDAAGRAYRDGGDMHGAGVSHAIAMSAVPRLALEGRFILYTGSPIIDGKDPLRDSLEALARQHGCVLRYREIDPDVFGEELETPGYRDVERIAIVGAVIQRPPSASLHRTSRERSRA